MEYNVNEEAIAATNELFYRNGPTPEAIAPSDAKYVIEVLFENMQAAYYAGLKAADAMRKIG